MKKLLMICLMIAIAASTCISVCATSGFVSSPTGNEAPELVEGENEDEKCEAEIIVTAYGERDTLPPAARTAIENAYASIVNADSIKDLNDSIEALSGSIGASVENLSVSDLFDISFTDCSSHEDHGRFDVTLKADTLKNFVALMQYDNGVWRIVEGAEVTNNGENLEFDVEDPSAPFAIVVNTGAWERPQQDEAATSILEMAVGAGCALALGGSVLYFVSFFKKKKG